MEVIGHSSNAIDKYQIMSDLQCKEMSAILQCNKTCYEPNVSSTEIELKIMIKKGRAWGKNESKDKKIQVIDKQVETCNVGKGKTMISIKIEIPHE